MIKNYMEELVEQILKNLLKNSPEYADVCRCEDCINDIMAKALNNIKPFYVTGKTGEVYGEYFVREFQNNTNVVMEVARAIECVSKNSHHSQVNSIK